MEEQRMTSLPKQVRETTLGGFSLLHTYEYVGRHVILDVDAGGRQRRSVSLLRVEVGSGLRLLDTSRWKAARFAQTFSERFVGIEWTVGMVKADGVALTKYRLNIQATEQIR
jgi:hypothetical protein